jgi:LuxR family maltose regulon positive regulatory protein
MPQQLPSIVRTKLFVVRPHGDLIRRERLASMLDNIPHRRLTLLSAPPGFGKTTLLSEWIERKGFPTVWLSLDAADNDLKRFLTYIVGALRTRYPDIGDPLLEGLELAPLPPLDYLLTALINELIALPEHLLLVLDDYHRIDNQGVHDALLFLLEHAPEQLHIAMTTRIDPPLPLSRLRVRGQLLELRATDLRFSAEETDAFFNQQMRLGLSEGQLVALQGRTEGWIAGLKMAAISLEGRDDIEAFIADFTGADRYVLDYLIEEVINRQAPELQGVMLELSVLDRFSGALCEAVTGCENGTELLHRLERANLFLIPLDNRREWYRYHHLFGELLNHRLQQANPDLIPELHRRASRWLEDEGMVADAVDHAIAAGDKPLLARIMVRQRVKIIQMTHAEGRDLLELMDLIPNDLITQSAILCILKSWAVIHPNREFELVEELLEIAERLTEPIAPEERAEEYYEIVGQISLLRSIIARDRGDSLLSIEYGEEALKLLPEHLMAVESRLWNISRGMILKILGGSYGFAGMSRKATEVMKESLVFDRQTGNVHLICMSLSNLARQYALQGQLNATEACYDEFSSLLIQIGDEGFAVDRCGPFLLRTRVELERAKYDDAIVAVRRALQLNAPENTNMELVLRQLVVLIYDAMRDFQQAWQELEIIRRVPIAEYELRLKTVAPTLHAVLSMRTGDLNAAVEWSRRFFDENDPTATPRSDEFPERTYFHARWEQLVYARVLVEQGSYERAHQVLGMLSAEFEREDVPRMLIEALVLTAVAYEREGNKDKALDLLLEALKHGRPEGYIRPFTYDARDIAPILARLQRRGIPQSDGMAAYVERVAKECGIVITIPVEQRQPAQAINGEQIQLTSREMEILQLMSLGYSNQKIADKLYVSINTIKTHASNLFDKLEASNRVDALVRARAAGILE